MGVYTLIIQPANAIPVEVSAQPNFDSDRVLKVDNIEVSESNWAMKRSAKSGALFAYLKLKKTGSLSKGNSLCAIYFPFKDAAAQITGPSAGLAFLVKTAQVIIEKEYEIRKRKDFPRWNCAATGIISNDESGAVEKVERIREKLEAALRVLEKSEVVFYPRANLNEELKKRPEAFQTLKKKFCEKEIELVPVNNAQEVLDWLVEKYKITPFVDDPPTQARRYVQWGSIAALVVLLVFSWWLFLRPTLEAQVKTLFKDGVTKVGVFIEVSQASTLYAFYEDGNGSLCWLPTLHLNSDSPHRYWAPRHLGTQGGFLVPNQLTGKERVFVWATSASSPLLDGLRKAVTKDGSDEYQCGLLGEQEKDLSQAKSNPPGTFSCKTMNSDDCTANR